MKGLIHRLRIKADEAECAAEAEEIIILGLLPFRKLFDEGDRSNFVMRRLRVLVNAEQAVRGFRVDTMDFRTAAHALQQNEEPT